MKGKCKKVLQAMRFKPQTFTTAASPHGHDMVGPRVTSEHHGYGYTHGFHTGLAAGTSTRLPTRQKPVPIPIPVPVMVMSCRDSSCASCMFILALSLSPPPVLAK